MAKSGRATFDTPSPVGWPLITARILRATDQKTLTEAKTHQGTAVWEAMVAMRIMVNDEKCFDPALVAVAQLRLVDYERFKTANGY